MMMPDQPRIQLLGRDNGAGLSRDMQVLSETLTAVGAKVTMTGLPHRTAIARAFTKWRLRCCKPRFIFNIMLERIRPEFSQDALRNILIPNPEYFDTHSLATLPIIDEVWCKTHHAKQLFSTLGKPCHYLGFTSLDRYLPNIPREHAFFHGPGRSNNKGSQALINLWAKHPQWPTLTVVWRCKSIKLSAPLPDNVRLLREHLNDATYRELQNRYRFHLCPSQTEGFGHYLVEAMSCANVIVTLNAAPMNELIDSNRGILVESRAIGKKDLATLYEFDEMAMTKTIERCIEMTTHEARQYGQAARDWFLTCELQKRLTNLISA